MTPEELIPLNVSCIINSDSRMGSYTMILHCEKLNKQIPVIIGEWEARYIAMLTPEHIHMSRPMPYDMMYEIMSSQSLSISKVLIHKFLDGIFYSYIYTYSPHTGIETIIDSRTSDAIAMALRFGAPIYTYSHIVLQTGISLRSTQELSQMSFTSKDKETDTSSLPPDITQLRIMMEQAVGKEDYETAAILRDKIKKIDPDVII